MQNKNSVVKNTLKLYDKRNDIINAFANKYIFSRGTEEDVYYGPKISEPKFEKSMETKNQTLQTCLN